jgi:CTP-dependent riboflavin kinase
VNLLNGRLKLNSIQVHGLDRNFGGVQGLECKILGIYQELEIVFPLENLHTRSMNHGPRELPIHSGPHGAVVA